jgi:hypothetical protein
MRNVVIINWLFFDKEVKISHTRVKVSKTRKIWRFTLIGF